MNNEPAALTKQAVCLPVSDQQTCDLTERERQQLAVSETIIKDRIRSLSAWTSFGINPR